MIKKTIITSLLIAATATTIFSQIKAGKKKESDSLKNEICGLVPMRIIRTNDTLSTILFNKITFPVVINLKRDKGSKNLAVLIKSQTNKSTVCIRLINSSPAEITEIIPFTKNKK